MTLQERAEKLQFLLFLDGMGASLEECRTLIISDFIQQTLDTSKQSQ